MSQLTGTVLVVVLIVVIIGLAASPGTSHPAEDKKSVLEYTLPLSDGTQQPLESYRGKVLLLVNVASKCGFTGQYEGLQKLHTKYESEGFSVLAFPANDFLGQEPGTNEEIVTFCRMSYGVTFPVFAKISVIGKDQHPLYRFLTNEATNPGFSGNISWNFNKFLINRQGKVIGKYGSRTVPEDAELVAQLEKALQEKP
ncbi:MAG: glutathione peroxidase [Candidatus Riflebacteria bacterium HGW-Riflebacteria-2]|jgi:glutathione peroxidase|nr:MAG: glutathione peroxidase [Candidatus Riflebacteria bacterium HGW-Riflebacteria-2]